MAANAVKGEFVRENLIHTIDTIQTFDLGGLSLKFGPEDHQGMDRVFLTIIQNDKIKPIEE